ncbi:MAG: TetR/AcrR family transcriptional regulator [Parvularculaceae bacterium]|nr:TetR/AcrR family transcriptional regulator [Parvularculaceae bacterium]
MSGRRERKKGETRARILNAAIALMTERGYDAVKVEDIAARADVANATFFLHFPTKASLLSAFNERVAQSIADRLEGFSLGAVEKLELVRALVLDEWGRHGDLLRRIVADAATQDGAGLIASSESLARLVADVVREGQQTDELSTEFSADLVATALVSAWRASTLQWAATGDSAAARRANREALDLILKGALPR